ncbi:MAG: hypothetical protein CBD88_01500 [Flavobacteriales bacterium TMED228]|nr:MAG: hypothetical protein CBD88_01500 [Flavobacteriales bacterium TMED228]
MKNYQNTIKFTFGLVIIIQISLIFFGYLRPSIIYDYLDFWPITIFPFFILLIFRKTNIKEQVSFYIFIFLTLVFLFFQAGHFFNAQFLSTYSYDSSFQNLNLDSSVEYQVFIDENNTIDLNYFIGSGYKIDIIDEPGKSGFPEAIETIVGSPRAIIFREVDTSSLLKVKGWDIELGSQDLWKLDIFSIDSIIHLDNLNLSPSSLSGTGEIYLGPNLNLKELILNGKYEITVSKQLPIVVRGNATVPPSWLNATVGYLNQIDETYKLEIEIIDGSEVIFNDG